MIPIFFLLLFLSPPTLCELLPDFRSLLEFKKGIHDPSGQVTSSWDVTALPSTWRGVSTINSSEVIVVDLSGLNLSGELKFSTLTSLSRLQTLNLSNNNFTGRLVPSIGSIQLLQNLDLSNNQFYGPVPGRIADLYGLVNLNLSNNMFEGEFPTNLRNLQQLRFLDLKSNRFFGDVGRLFSEMHNVEYVDLSGNRFFGQLFVESGIFSNVVNTMKYMNLSRNVISGVFGRSVGLFKNLEVLDLSGNKMNGVLPEIGGMLNLKVLRVGRNFLFGMIPEELFKSGMQLVEIDLSGNGFTESTPREHSSLSVKQRLNIAIEVAQCLHHLHQDRALPHGNLKPTNIILTGPTLSACLTDYGLHRLLTPNGISEQILNLGALGYRAPEQQAEARKPLPSFEADVYAFGVILMELLTGRSAGDIISGQLGAVDLIDWVQMRYREGRVTDCYDTNIVGLEDFTRVMDELLAVSLKCILPVTQRPSIRTVLHNLCSITV